jgi:hypothetical protein
MKTFRVWRDGAPVDLPEGDDNPYTLTSADLSARRLQWHVEAVYDGRRVARFLSITPASLQVLHSAETGWTLEIVSFDEAGDLTFEVTIGASTFGPFTRTAAQQASGVPVNHIAPVIAETATSGTYEVTSPGLWTHGLTDPAVSYQWTRNGTPISGATSVTYVTGAPDAGTDLRCEVSVASTAAASNAIGIAAGGPTFAAAFTARAIDPDEFEHPKVFNGVDIGAADATRRLYVFLYWRAFSTTDSLSLSINGGGAISPTATIRSGGARQIALFEADVPTGTTANFSFTNGDSTFLATGMAVVRAVGAHTSGTATAAPTSTTTPAITATTLSGDRIFLALNANNGTNPNYGPPAGFTEAFDEYFAPASGIPQPSTLSSGTAAGGSPETFTSTSDASSLDHSVLLLRLRAS